MASQQTQQSAGPRSQQGNIGMRQRGQDQGNGWQQSEREGANKERLARALGWFSIGVGLAGVVAPQRLARFIGVSDGENTRAMLRTIGLREVTTGVGILGQQRPAGWLWARVGGDLMDLALLGSALTSSNASRGRVAAATAAVAGVTALDVYCSEQLSRSPSATTQSGAVHVKKSITVNRSPEELYRFWRNFENLPRFMDHLESVQVTSEKQSHWKAKAVADMTFEWDSEITDDQPNALIAWRSLAGAELDSSGSVRFEQAAGGRGTIVRVEMQYNPPGGAIGAAVAKLFGKEPGQQLLEGLRRFKQIMEVGEVVQSDASIHLRRKL